MKNDFTSDIIKVIQIAFTSLQNCIDTLKDTNFDEESYEHLKDYYLALCGIVQVGPFSTKSITHWSTVSYLSHYIINSDAMHNCKLGYTYTNSDPDLNVGHILKQIAIKATLCYKLQSLDPAEAEYILSEVQSNISWLSFKYLEPLYKAYSELLEGCLDPDDFSPFFFLVEKVYEEEAKVNNALIRNLLDKPDDLEYDDTLFLDRILMY